eukprot:tig00000079_g2798.t1
MAAPTSLSDVAILEKLGGIGDQLQTMQSKMEQLETKMEQLETKMEQLETKMENVKEAVEEDAGWPFVLFSHWFYKLKRN